jgi:hypothetical protein
MEYKKNAREKGLISVAFGTKAKHLSFLLLIKNIFFVFAYYTAASLSHT